MEIAIGAARWVVGRALSPVTDGLLESWAASSELGPNVRALKLELLYAQGMLNNARGRDLSNPALAQLLLELRHLAYNADDVLDELEYFRIQDDLDGTYETTDAADDRGLVFGIILNARHTARAVARKLKFSSCSCAFASRDDRDEEQEDAKQGCLSSSCSCGGRKDRDSTSSPPPPPSNNGDMGVHIGCMAQVISSAHNSARAVGKRLPCYSLPSVHDNAQTKVECIVHAPKLKFDRVEVSRRMAEIIEQLKPLCAKVATILDLEISGSNRTTSQGIDLHRTKTTTPQIIEATLYGRGNHKNNVVDIITHGKDSANNLTVISIVGSGGIGKTTFTQHIYAEVKSHFHVPIWICVSLDFNAKRLAQEIVKQIVKQMPKVQEENKNASDEELIEKGLQSKQFILVLDDMWICHEDEWKKLLAPFKKGGTRGNMIIVTTRIPKVAKMVATRDCLIRLERLKHEDCMHFFQACVFDGQQLWKGHPDLHKVGEDIVKRLKGSPLAVKTVGRLLRNQLTLNHWRKVLESKEWELQKNDDDIMPALKLSFNYLPFDLQQCFSYCALFPEDYEFDSKELIHLWIGLGLLDTRDQNKRTEDIGEDYLNDLVDYGFFQKNFEEDSHPYYLIHDLLHELAVNVSSYECLVIHGSNLKSLQIPASIRHLSIIIDNEDVKDRVTFENYKMELNILGRRLRAENLRTLMLFGQHHGSFSKTFGELFSEAKSLRTIFLSEASYNVEDILRNFSQLIHLRYLRIKDYESAVISLPSGISRFYHLVVLDLQQCNDLHGSLREISNLVKLRHFLVPNEEFHCEIFEVGKLKILQELMRFEIKKEMSGFELKQLGQLLELRGSLAICNLERVEAIKEADEAKLVHMNYLHKVTLHWDIGRSNKDPKQEHDILERLKPQSELRELCIRGHGGSTCPTWLGVDLSIKNLEHLCLDGVAWNSLPALGELWMVNEHGEEYIRNIRDQSFCNLKRVELVNIERLKKWCGNGTSHLFPLLEVLVVSDCPNLIELPFSHSTCRQAELEENMSRFPKLREINVSKCPHLLSLPAIPWTHALCDAEISQVGAGIVSLSFTKNQQRKSINVNMGKDALDSELWNMLVFYNLKEIELFDMEECPPMPLDHMQMLASLKTLFIWNCTNVLRPVERESKARYQFPVEYLHINECGANGIELTQLMSYFPNLSRLHLSGCKAVTRMGVAEKHATATPTRSPSDSDHKTEDAQIGQEQQHGRGEEDIEAANEELLLLPPQIHDLRISDCPELSLYSSSLDDSIEAAGGLLGLHSLRSLDILHCPKFLSSCSSSSYSPFPTSLQRLAIAFTLGGMFTLAPLSNLTNVTMRYCDDLRVDDIWHLLAQGHLTTLGIYGCPNLFTGSEPPRIWEQGLSNPSRLQDLHTDGIAGVLAVPICAHLSSSLTELCFSSNNDIERFTKEQEEALQILTSLQELQIRWCSKLQSLPAGLRGLLNLRKLAIWDCPALRSLPKDGLPRSLTELEIRNCPALRSPTKGSLPSSLRVIDVKYSKNEELTRQCRKLKGTIPIIKA